MIDTPYTDNYLKENFSQNEIEKFSKILQMQKREILVRISRQAVKESNETLQSIKLENENQKKLMELHEQQWADTVNPQTKLFEKA